MAVIEVFADIWCPFSHVGLHTVARRRAELGRPDIPIRVRSWPLEIVNGRPLDADAAADHARALRDQVAPTLFAGVARWQFPATTLPALALESAAYRLDAATGEAVSFALRDLLFEYGLDISRPDVLEMVAQAHSLDANIADVGPVLADWHEGQNRGVRGSPHFFCAGRDAFCPSLLVSDDGAHRRVDLDTGALDRFLEGCFAASEAEAA